MEFPDAEEPEYSPGRYMLSGAGCGCGCLGLLLLLASSMALVMIPLQMYPEGPGNAGMWGILGTTFGLVLVTIGVGGYGASLFID